MSVEIPVLPSKCPVPAVVVATDRDDFLYALKTFCLILLGTTLSSGSEVPPGFGLNPSDNGLISSGPQFSSQWEE